MTGTESMQESDSYGLIRVYTGCSGTAVSVFGVIAVSTRS